MNNNYAVPELDNMLKVISSLTNLSESQLEIVLKYTSSSVKTETMQLVLDMANRLYNNRRS